MNLEAYVEERRKRVEHTLEAILPLAQGPAKTIAEAVRYAVLAGGKRMRPILAIAACEACGGVIGDVLEPASALELIHTYSLMHDDLPAMDDDDLRRGRPTVHHAFGEAEAILAGDAALTLAFELLASLPAGPDVALRRLEATVVAARCAGIAGMVGGQIADLEGERTSVDFDRLRWIHRHKTGALFAASASVGAIHAGAGSEAREAMEHFGGALGLAFQVADDILDCTATAAELGKTPGKDARAGKATCPSLLGLEQSRELARELVREAQDMLKPLGLLSAPLEALSEFAASRTR